MDRPTYLATVSAVNKVTAHQTNTPIQKARESDSQREIIRPYNRQTNVWGLDVQNNGLILTEDAHAESIEIIENQT